LPPEDFVPPEGSQAPLVELQPAPEAILADRDADREEVGR
jgi:hypothetical protein